MADRMSRWLEWRRFPKKQWHRVRLQDGTVLCRRPILAPGYERRDLRAAPPVTTRCGNCEASWRIDRWARARYRRWRRRQAAAERG